MNEIIVEETSKNILTKSQMEKYIPFEDLYEKCNNLRYHFYNIKKLNFEKPNDINKKYIDSLNDDEKLFYKDILNNKAKFRQYYNAILYINLYVCIYTHIYCKLYN